MTTTLTIDVGASDLKMLALAADGSARGAHVKTPTPRPATPTAVLGALRGMLEGQGPFDRVAVGFPGVVTDGIVRNAPNLDPPWEDFPLAAELERLTGRPTRVANDADVQGYGAIEGRGVELVVTLGTGCGTALFNDGALVPNMELGHHPFRDGLSYEDLLGAAGLAKTNVAAWNAELRAAIATWRHVFNFHRLYLGGGNARLIEGELPAGVSRVDNRAGLLGGLALFRA